MRPDLSILSTFSQMSSLLTIELIRLKPDSSLRNLTRRWSLQVSYRLSHFFDPYGNYQQLRFNRINKLQAMLYSTRELIHSLDLTMRQCGKNVCFKTVMSVLSCKMLRHKLKKKINIKSFLKWCNFMMSFCETLFPNDDITSQHLLCCTSQPVDYIHDIIFRIFCSLLL